MNAAVFSVGLRPCSGALIVLVFALAQGIFWAGVASTFLMALGTAITVAGPRRPGGGAKGIAGPLAAGNGRRSGQVMLGLELSAAVVRRCARAVLFVGSLQA
jgi:nickel/cobalt exporter